MNLDYFKDKNLKLLFDTLKDKYIRTSKLTGVIKVFPKTLEEAKKISLFLGQNINKNEESIIKITTIEKSIEQSRFSEVSLLEILEYLYGKMVTKQEIKLKKEEENNTSYHLFLETYKNTLIYDFLITSISNDENFNKKIQFLFHRNLKLLYFIMDGLNQLPAIFNTYVNLSVFATNITKDPHYFDLDTSNIHHFLWFVSKYFDMDYDKTRESQIKILNQAGIYIDNYSNFILTYHFLGESYIEEFYQRNEVMILNLDNINKIENIYSGNKKVVILENPSLLSSVVSRSSDFAFIITSGNPNISFYQLLDKLKEHEFYYNGDFDPEGLLIASKLKTKYVSSLHLIGYTKEMYEQSMSTKELSEARLKKLEKINVLELETIKNCLMENKKSGYQEKIIENILSSLEVRTSR